jgi:hypothetical protein
MKNVWLALGSVAVIGAVSDFTRKGSMAQKPTSTQWNAQTRKEWVDYYMEKYGWSVSNDPKKTKVARSMRVRLLQAAQRGPEQLDAQIRQYLGVGVSATTDQWVEAAHMGHEALGRVREKQKGIIPKIQAEIERLRATISDLREENADLRSRLEEYEV